MAFFGASGPGSLTGGGGPDPETQKVLKAIQRAYPQLGSPTTPGSAPQSPTTISQLGYGGQGPQLYYGQGNFGANPFNSVNNLFERSAGSTSDSITSALSSGQVGPTYSGAQQGVGTVAQPPFGGGLGPGGGGLGQFSTAGYGAAPGVADMGGGLTGGSPQTLDIGALARGGAGLYNMFTGQPQSVGTGAAGSNPALAQQRAGEQAPAGSGLPTSGFPFGGAGLQQEVAAGGAPPSDIFNPNVIGGGGGGYGGSYNASGLAPGQTQATQPGGLFGTGVSGNQVLGGINTAGGLLNLYQGIQNRNPLQTVGGGIGTVGGAMATAPETSAALLGSSAPFVSGALSGLGGGLGIYGGIQALQRGDTLGGITQLGTGTAGLYGGAAGIANAVGGAGTLPTLTDLGSSAISGIGNLFGGGAGAGAGAAAGDAAGAAAGEAGGAAAGEAGAGLAGGIAALPGLAITAADVISGIMDTNKAQAGAQQAYRGLTAGLPGAINSLQQVPGQVAGFNPQTATPEQALALLQSLESTQNMFAGGGSNPGIWDFLNQGGTTASGGAAGQDVTLNYPGGPGMLQGMMPYFNQAILGEVRAEDVLGRAGMAGQIPQRPGADYMNPNALAIGMINAAGQGGGLYAPLQQPGGQFDTSGPEWQAFNNQMATGNYTSSPWGAMNTPMWNQISGLQPGGLESGIGGIIQQLQAQQKAAPATSPLSPAPLDLSLYGGASA